MSEIKRIAIDTSKSVFTLYAVDAGERPVWRGNLRRRELLRFFAKQPPVEVVLEACGGSHHWGRSLQALGHRVRLLPAQYVKPFVKREPRTTATTPRRSASPPRSLRSAACR